MTEKAPEIWDKIESEASASLPPKREKPRFSPWRSPVALVLSLVLLVGVIVAVPTLSRLLSTDPVETTGSTDDPWHEDDSSPYASETTAKSTVASSTETTCTTTVESASSTFDTTCTTPEETTETTIEWTWATMQTTYVTPTAPTFEEFCATEPFYSMLPSALPDGYAPGKLQYWRDDGGGFVNASLTYKKGLVSTITFHFIPQNDTGFRAPGPVTEDDLTLTDLENGWHTTSVSLLFPSYSMEMVYQGVDALSPADLAAMINSAPYFS